MPDDRRARLRAADADRELVHEILSAAMAHGSLSPVEYEERFPDLTVRLRRVFDIHDLVGSAQSKDELIARPRGMDYLVVTGRRGGSAMAAAAVNAIASERE